MCAFLPRFYDEFAEWWPLFSPPADYLSEAADLLPRLRARASTPHPTLLELGSGGGSLAFYLKRHFKLTLTDRAAGMLAISRTVNPECEHLSGDMRRLRLHRQFDVVLVHDAIMYATQPMDVASTLHTAALHCHPGGLVAVLPDYVRETFTARTDCGGHDGADGRALRYLEWHWDPDPSDDTYVVDYAFVLRSADATVTVLHDRHIHGLFSRARWMKWFGEVGLSVQHSFDRWERDIFLATPARTGAGA